MSRIAVIDREHDETEINLTPMLDVVFIMLVFFIVTSTFIRELGLPVTTAEAGAVIEEEPSAILILIDADDEIWMDGRRIDPAALRANFERLGALERDRSVVVQPASASSTEVLVRVIDAAMLADLSDIAVAGESAGR